MRQLVIISFISLYMVALLQPYMPFINYQLNKEYISKVLCENRNKPQMHCNGKCHLNKQLKKSAAESEKNNSTARSNVPDYITLQTNNNSGLHYKLSLLTEVGYSNATDYFLQLSVSIFHPPTA